MGSDAERLFREREPQDANDTLRESDQILAKELDAAQHLQHVATKLISAQGTEALYEEILDAALAILHADFASIQMFYPERGTSGELRLLGHRGFSAEAAKRWEWVRPSTQTTCGEALRIRKRVFVADVRNCDFMAGSEDLEGYLSAGIHAVQSTPLVSRSGAFLGMVSTHWREPHELSASELSGLDILARMAADLIDRSRAEEALRVSEAQARAQAAELQAIMDAAPANIFVTHDAECRHLRGNRNAYLSLRLPLGSNLSLSASPGDRPPNLRVLLNGVEIPPQEMPVQRAALTGQAVRNSELQVLFEDGTSLDLLGNAEPLFDENGRPSGAVGVLSDVTERKHAESRLRESEERFRNMADSAPVLIWISGPDKLRTFFNKPWLDFTGRTLDEELGNEWAVSIHPEDRERYFAVCDSAFEARRHFQIEYRLRRSDKQYRWMLVNGTPLNRGAEFAGFIGCCTDITAQKLVEERLRASEVQLKDAQRLAKVGSWDFHIETATSCWSDENRRILGVPDDVPANLSTFIACVHPQDRDKVLEGARTASSTGETGELRYRILRPDGEVRFAHSVFEALRNDQGIAVRIVGATQDITEQVKARELLRQNEERLRRAEGLAHLGHWHLDLKTNQLTWSEECFRIFGRPPDYAPGFEDFYQAIVPEGRPRLERGSRHRIETNNGSIIEFRIVRPDGEQRTVRSISEVLVDEEGRPASLFGACQDITDVIRAQEESAARQKLESVGTLARGIAHDFNNLLGGVLAQAELGLGELAAGSTPEAELKTIRQVALRGSEIVRELMIYAGKESAIVNPVDVSQIVADMLQLLKVSVSKRARLEVNLETDLPPIQANAAQLGQIVMNLVVNASDAIGDRDGVIRVSTRSERDHVVLEVSDTGQGMSLETQARVFDPFFTTKSTGQGLGLAVVQGIVRNLGGSIQLNREPGKCTAFQILLPCSETQTGVTSDDASGSEQPVRPTPNATVLIVEDEFPLRQAIASLLRNSGFQVLEAADGTSAINLIRINRGTIDAILLDMSIPGASSAEVVAEAAKAQPDIKVILTSAYGEETINAIGAPQIRGFVRKPFQFTDLMKTLQRSLVG